VPQLGKAIFRSQRPNARNWRFEHSRFSGDQNPPAQSAGWPEIEGGFAETGKTRFDRECVVADAVTCEPVSAAEFPANREINREFCRIRPRRRFTVVNRQTNSMLCSRIPYATEQGIILGEQGILKKEQGVFTGQNQSIRLS
jgi:hypothetical protein